MTTEPNPNFICRYEVLLWYARFLYDDVGNIEEAGGHLRECIQIDSGDSRAIGFYAKILHEHYKDVGLSDRLYDSDASFRVHRLGFRV